MDQIDTSSLNSKPSKKNEKVLWPEVQSTRQGFSLPDSSIYYITKNPSTTKYYSKMIQSCKYFFEKNPILIVTNIYGVRMFCSKTDDECTLRCCAKFDIIKMKSKIWLTNNLRLSTTVTSEVYKSLALKLYRCEDAKLSLCSTKIAMKDFQLFASKFQKFDINHFFLGTKILDIGGNVVVLENILESIPNVKEFLYNLDGVSSIVTASTMKNISQLQNLGNLQSIVLFDIAESFNVKDLGDFIKNHEHTKFWFGFNADISDQYKNELDQLVDTVIASQIPNRVIRYRGLNIEKETIMLRRYTY